jgi:hypothetical protein
MELSAHPDLPGGKAIIRTKASFSTPPNFYFTIMKAVSFLRAVGPSPPSHREGALAPANRFDE